MPSYRKILALDTALNGCCVGIYNADTQERFSKAIPMVSGQAEHLLPMAQELLQEAGINFQELDAILVARGPGAFTGLRIGISTAKALGLALAKPVFGVSNLYGFADQFVRANSLAGALAVIIETKRDDFYIQIFSDNLEALSQPETASAQAISERLSNGSFTVVGNGLTRLRNSSELHTVLWKDSFEILDAGLLAYSFYENHTSNIYTTPVPLYLRDADVSQSKKIQRILSK